MAFTDIVVSAEGFTSLPERFRDKERRSAWIDANKPGAKLDSFLEGPTFPPDGALFVTDIPHGRIFRISADGDWSLVADYDGWPNGMRWQSDGHLYIADYKRGILRLRAGSSVPEPVFETHRSEGFKGCNDLWFAGDGTLYFTDQGQTGLHDSTGRVYRADVSTGQLDVRLSNGPSPNGLVTAANDSVLFVAMTRACEVWRLPLFASGTSKVQLFARLPAGNSGPDGMALDSHGNLYVCHASRGAVFVFSPDGDEIGMVDCRHLGRTTTNLAFAGPDRTRVFVTVSDTGVIASADVSALAA